MGLLSLMRGKQIYQLCEVSPSGYYAWQGRPARKHQRDDMIYLMYQLIFWTVC